MAPNQNPSSNQNKEDHSGLVIALIIAFVIILYVLSLGKFNPVRLRNKSEELSESLEKAKARHARLQAIINKKATLKGKLEKRFKNIFLGVRILLVVLWLFLLVPPYAFGLINNLGDFLNYSQLLILVLVALNFLAFGTLTNLNFFLDGIKIRLQNWIYGKYVNLDGELSIHVKELVSTQSIIVAISQEIEAPKQILGVEQNLFYKTE